MKTETKTETLSPKWLDQVDIRHLRQSDLPALEWEGEYTIFRRMFKQAYQDTRRGRGLMWVAEYLPDAHLVGQVFIQLHSLVRPEIADGFSKAYLYSVRVRSRYHGQGLGTRLMRVAENDLRRRGYQIVHLNVAQDNQKGFRFYRKLGYQTFGHDPGQWSYIDHEGVRRYVDEPAWRMEKRLGPPG